MTLGQKQEAFSRSFAKLLMYADMLGVGVRIGEVLRTKEQAEIYAKQGKGIINSNHRNKLAVDIILTKDGQVLWDGDEYKKLARKWKSYSKPGLDHCWGGDFSKYRDVYHFSIKHGGVV